LASLDFWLSFPLDFFTREKNCFLVKHLEFLEFTPYLHLLFLVLDFEFLPLRQKERFVPEAHLQGDVQSDLDFAGHPVFFLPPFFDDSLARASAKRFDKLAFNFLFLNDFCRRAAAAANVFFRPSPPSKHSSMHGCLESYGPILEDVQLFTRPFIVAVDLL
jgi:hypothetical protein